MHTYIIVNQNSGSIPNLLLLRILHTTEVGLMATHIIHRGSVSLCSSDVNFKAASHSLKTNKFNPISVLKTILHSVLIGPHCSSLKKHISSYWKETPNSAMVLKPSILSLEPETRIRQGFLKTLKPKFRHKFKVVVKPKKKLTDSNF